MNTGRKRSIAQWLNQEKVAGYICTLPFSLGFLLFMLVPMGISLYYSFCSYDILNPPVFTGLSNFQRMLADEKWLKALIVTMRFAFISTPLRLIFALLIAMLLLKGSTMSGVYRAMYYLPSMIGGSVSVAILWKRMFAVDGTINILLSLAGIKGPAWLGLPSTAIWTLIILAVWQFGSSMLIFLAALKQIPASLYEASEIDGANKIQSFFKLTLPLLTPTIFFNLVMQLINGFLAFTQSYIITQGKPMDTTLFYTVYMYQQSFQFSSTGYGAAMAWAMLLIVGLFTWILFATKRFWVYDGGF